MVCIQVIQNAISSTGQCKSFPTPCDVPTGWKNTDSCPLSVASSTGLTDIEAQKQAKELKADFKLKTFASCTQMEDTMKKFIESYYSAQPGGYYRGGGIMMMEDAAVGASVKS